MYVRFARAGEGMKMHVAVSYTNEQPESPITPQERGLAMNVIRTANQTPSPDRWAGPFCTYMPWMAIVTPDGPTIG